MDNIMLAKSNGVVLTNPLQFKGNIAVNTNFPLIANVKNGWFYTISATVTDNAGSTYTNTGQSFVSGDEIVWNGTNWTLLGNTANFVPYTGSSQDVNLGTYNLTTTGTGTFNEVSTVNVRADYTSPGNDLNLYATVGSGGGINMYSQNGVYIDKELRVDGTHIQLGTSTTAGYVLTADADGKGTWQEATAGSEIDPVYSANTYATGMNQGVATTDNVTFNSVKATTTFTAGAYPNTRYYGTDGIGSDDGYAADWNFDNSAGSGGAIKFQSQQGIKTYLYSGTTERGRVSYGDYGYIMTDNSGNLVFYDNVLMAEYTLTDLCNHADWGSIDGTQSGVSLSGFNNDLGGYTGDLIDSNSNKIADVVGGIITAVYY